MTLISGVVSGSTILITIIYSTLPSLPERASSNV